MQHFIKESRIASPPSTVFEFHESPGALERLIPPWEQVEVVEAPRSLRPGARAVLRTKLGPFRLDWIAEHTEYARDRLFADRQVKGPFSFWHHRHCFGDDGEGGTILRDEVEYRLPFGAIGELVAGRFIRSRIQRTFDYRHEVTRQACEPVASPKAVRL
ncbi:MAG: SRPBCC family protein [Paludisphaera borealis]|uniref:SRPBCC family protein n=1 Tax=Paludisphaera borealis TaxID=1387353 RepID=UPI00284CC333|nr:SRPBCC family protein [Paludisphaera borealis]MDR3620780.1 SRPBCC family protein [Paludisphaera borealis]